jgi:opacity protein-like surface antigen
LRITSAATVVVTQLASCSSMLNGVASIEARGAIALESAAAVTGGALVGAGGGSGAGYDVDIQTPGYGVGAAVNSPLVDLISGFDVRSYNDEHVPEFNIGLRKRFGADKQPLYVFALARSSRSDSDGETYFNGSAIGLGLILQLTPNVFVDISGAYERTGHLQVEPERSNYEQGIFQFGLGFSF